MLNLVNTGSKLPAKTVVANAMECARYFSKAYIQSMFFCSTPQAQKVADMPSLCILLGKRQLYWQLHWKL
ncbi:MAG: hypothetical protein WAW02_13640 [Sideroxyarcus sp.]